jgi:hypothetical protein
MMICKRFAILEAFGTERGQTFFELRNCLTPRAHIAQLLQSIIGATVHVRFAPRAQRLFPKLLQSQQLDIRCWLHARTRELVIALRQPIWHGLVSDPCLDTLSEMDYKSVRLLTAIENPDPPARVRQGTLSILTLCKLAPS